MKDWLHPAVTLPSASSTRPPLGHRGRLTVSRRQLELSRRSPRLRSLRQIQNWVEDGGKGTAAKSHRLPRLGTLRLLGLIAADEFDDGPFCVLSIVDHRTFRRRPTTSWTATRPKSTSRHSSAASARPGGTGLTVQGITTDGSTLSRPNRRSLRCGAASGLPIPHPARGEQGDPLGRGPGTQASGSRHPKLPRGRPTQRRPSVPLGASDQAEGG